VLLLGAVVLVVLVMSVVVFLLAFFSFRWSGLRVWGVSACSFVSVIALRLVLVSFLRQSIAGYFCSSGWASVGV
jgi:hypothetical protein